MISISAILNCSSTNQKRGPFLSRKEKLKQEETNPLHPLFQQEPVEKRLNSRRSFIHFHSKWHPSLPKNICGSNHLHTAQYKSFLPVSNSQIHQAPVNLSGFVSIPWKLRLEVVGSSCKNEDLRMDACDCGEEQTMKHMLFCPLLQELTLKKTSMPLTTRLKKLHTTFYWPSEVTQEVELYSVLNPVNIECECIQRYDTWNERGERWPRWPLPMIWTTSNQLATPW